VPAPAGLVLGELPARAGKPGEKRPSLTSRDLAGLRTLLRSAMQSAIGGKNAESVPAKGTVGAKRAESRV
jgi:hypothetical protein